MKIVSLGYKLLPTPTLFEVPLERHPEHAVCVEVTDFDAFAAFSYFCTIEEAREYISFVEKHYDYEAWICE